MLPKKIGFVILALIQGGIFSTCQVPEENHIKTAAERIELYMPLLKGKKCAIAANQTTVIGSVHLVDSLVNAGIAIKKIFSPEHGFRGTVAEGATIKNAMDTKTGVPIISLYGEKIKPSTEDLKDIEVMIYDIQDVGVRFYTYISTLHYIMQACAENHIPLIVFDRPDPNGFYVDGPILEPAFKSFVGMHPIPIVYGLTVGELAGMINGEGWLGRNLRCDLTVIPCFGYTHKSRYRLPVNPSPSLRNMEAVYLYPSLGLFEGTIMNVGRGTPYPFQVYGHPDYPKHDFFYTPQASSIIKNPKHIGKLCYGTDFRLISMDTLCSLSRINLSWLINAYKTMNHSDFFIPFLDKLAGTDKLRKQIIAGQSEDQIRESWESGLEKYRQMRKKYLLYPD